MYNLQIIYQGPKPSIWMTSDLFECIPYSHAAVLVDAFADEKTRQEFYGKIYGTPNFVTRIPIWENFAENELVFLVHRSVNRLHRLPGTAAGKWLGELFFEDVPGLNRCIIQNYKQMPFLKTHLVALDSLG